MYTIPPVSISALLAPFPDEIKVLGDEIRNTIIRVIPEADEQVSGGHKVANVLYSLNSTQNVICGLQPSERFVRVFFHRWQKLKEAGYKLEGTGKHARHIKVYDLQQWNDIDFKNMIEIVIK